VILQTLRTYKFKWQVPNGLSFTFSCHILILIQVFFFFIFVSRFFFVSTTQFARSTLPAAVPGHFLKLCCPRNFISVYLRYYRICKTVQVMLRILPPSALCESLKSHAQSAYRTSLASTSSRGPSFYFSRATRTPVLFVLFYIMTGPQT
jgi:hypothetical protein